MLEALVGVRYLVDLRRSYALRLFFIIGLNLLVNGAGLTFFIGDPGPGVSLLGMLLLIIGALMTYVCGLAMLLSVYTVISVVGVTVGVAALTTVLSVMSGFEQDLQVKILGANAHFVVRKNGGGDIQDWQPMYNEVRQTPGVTGLSPYIEDEVIVTSSTGLTGVVVKGIDPDTISEVSELPTYVPEGQGGLDYLIDPAKILEDYPPAQVFFPPSSFPDEPESGPRSQPESFPVPSLPLDDRPYIPEFRRPNPFPEDELPDPIRHKRPPKPFLDDPFLNVPPPPPTSQELGPGELEVPFPPPAMPPEPRLLPGIFIGKQLAEKTLHVSVGDEVNLVTPWGELGPTGPVPKSRSFRVAGIFYSGMYELDAKYVYLTLPEAQRFLSLDDSVTGFEGRVYLRDKAIDLAETIQKKVSTFTGGPYEAVPWQELNKSLFSALKVEKQMMFLVLVIIILVASFFIVSSLLMVVVQKGKEIAILKSMGATGQMIMRIFLAAGSFIGVTGTLFGALGGYALCLLIQWRGVPIPADVYYISSLPVVIDPTEFMLVAAAAFIISLIATLYPSRLASRVKPIEGLQL